MTRPSSTLTDVVSHLLSRRFGFLLFIIPPLLALGAMNGLLELFTETIGAPGSSNNIWQRYEIVHLDKAVFSEGRFKYMTFSLVAAFLYPGLFIFSVIIILRNLDRLTAVLVILLGIVSSVYWTYGSAALNDHSTGSAILFQLTEKLALANYDPSFALVALFSAKMYFVLALFSTVFSALAGCSIMHRLFSGSDISFRELMRKRGELRQLLFLSSLFLTFVAVFVSEWVAWPAQFVQAVPVDSVVPATGKAQEIVSLAKEIRLYFGAGYSLTLLAFAIPATVVYQSCAASPTYRRFKKIDEQSSYLNVLSSAEFSAMLSIASPIAIPLAAGALGI